MVTKLFLRGLAVSRRCLVAVCSVALVLSAQAADTGVLRSGWQQYDTADWSAAGFNNHAPLVAAPRASLAAVDTTGWGTYFFIIGGLAAAAVVANRGGGSSSDGGSGDGGSNGSGVSPMLPELFALEARTCRGAEQGLVYQRSGLQNGVFSDSGGNRGNIELALNVVLETDADGLITFTNTGSLINSHLSLHSASSLTRNGVTIDGVLDEAISWSIQSFGSFRATEGGRFQSGTNNNIIAVRDAVEAGTGIAGDLETAGPLTLSFGVAAGVTPQNYALFRQDSKAYLALPVLDNNGNQLSCSAENGQTLTADQFAFGRGDVPSGTTIFSLREGLRGYINGDIAVRLNNFYFYGDSELRNMHLEHRLTPWSNGGFSLHTDSGYKRWDDGKSQAVYGKLTAMQMLSAQLDVYAQAATGGVQSEIYRDSPMRGLALGAFYDNLLTHDDAYHVRLEQRFAAVEAAQWRLAVDATIGDETRYWRLGAHSDRDGGGAHVFYTREF